MREYDELSEWADAMRAEIDHLRSINAELLEALVSIKALLGPDGEYAICKADGSKLWLGDDMIIGGAFEKADAAIAKARGE